MPAIVVAGVLLAAWLAGPRPIVAVLRLLTRRAGRDEAADIARRNGPLVPPGVDERLDVPYGPGRRCRLDVFRPGGATGPLPTVVWVHGGGWIGGTKDALRDYLRVLASHGFVTVGVDYSWAPEATFPRQPREVAAAVRFVVERSDELGTDPDRLILAGDSAGAQIAACVAAAIVDPGYARLIGVDPPVEPRQLRGTVLFCGAYFLRVPPPSDRRAAQFVRLLLWSYLGVRRPALLPAGHPASVGDLLTGAFPPTFVSAGNGDPLLSQSHRLVDQLGRVGVPVTELFFPDADPPVPHEYQVTLDTGTGRRALEAVVGFAHRYAGAAPARSPHSMPSTQEAASDHDGGRRAERCATSDQG
ncbi:Acetyl esterase/lipase [Blastococcus fimeti]|nr:Acetyl esterase/lipase [Blastococcus fimeti]